MQTTTKLCVLFLASVVLTACGNGGKAAKIPDADLRAKHSECKKLKSPSRIKVMACQNFERECARRKKDGNQVCY